VNAAAEVFVEYNWQLYRAEKSKGREFVGEQLTESEAALARAREPLRMFKERNQSVLLERELAAKVEALASTRAELGRTDADIASATARIAELRRSLRPAPSVVMTAEIQEQITEQLLATEAELRGLQAKRESLAGSIEASGTELGSLPPEQLEHSRLLADVKVAESTHEFVKKSYDEARIREAESVPEIRVVSPAIAPVYPERPIKILYVGTALGMALAVGIALAIVLEYSTRRCEPPMTRSAHSDCRSSRPFRRWNLDGGGGPDVQPVARKGAPGNRRGHRGQGSRSES